MGGPSTTTQPQAQNTGSSSGPLPKMSSSGMLGGTQPTTPTTGTSQGPGAPRALPGTASPTSGLTNVQNVFNSLGIQNPNAQQQQMQAAAQQLAQQQWSKAFGKTTAGGLM